MHSRAFDGSIPPIAITGMRTTSLIARSPSSPIGGPASCLLGVAQTGPAPMYSAPSSSAWLASSGVVAERPTSIPASSARSMSSSSRPRWTPSARSASAAWTSSLTTKVTFICSQSNRKGAPWSISSSVEASFSRSWTTVAPPSIAVRATSRSLTIAWIFIPVPEPDCPACPGRGCRARRRATRGRYPAPWRRVRRPRRRRRTQRAPRPRLRAAGPASRPGRHR
jgi:hypothetical protein